jgi:PAS domain S-box-containing protein
VNLKESKKIANKSLSELKDSFFSLFYSGPDVIFLIYRVDENGIKGEIIEANPGALSILQYSEEELLKMKITEIIHPSNLRYFNETEFRKNRFIDSEIEYLCKDGAVVHVDAINILTEVDNQSIVVSLSRDISQKHKEQINLIKNEENYRTIVRNLPLTDVYLVDKEMRILLADGSEMGRYGIDRNHFEGRLVTELDREEVIALVYPLIQKGLNGEEHTVETFLLDQWYEYHVIPLRDENQIYSVLLIVRNISNQKTSSERITQLSTILDNSNNAASIKDRDFRYIGVNKTFLSLNYIKSEEEVIGKTDFDIFGKSEMSRNFLKTDKEALRLKQGEFLSYEQKFINKKSEVSYSLTKKFPIFNDEKKLTGVANISTDISNLKSVQEKLIQRENQYKTLIENQGEGVGIVDKNEKFIFANPSANEIFEAENLIGLNLLDFIDKKGMESVQEQTKLRKKGEKTSYELEITSIKGNKKTILVTATPQKDDNGTVIGTFGIFRDISERKQIEETLLHSEKRLKESNSSKDKFFSIIAHDLKNPFNSILGFSELLLENYDDLDEESIKKYIKLIKDASVLSHNLLDNLLHWSRSQTGRIKVMPERISIFSLISESVQLLKNNADKKKITINTNIEPSLKAYADPNMFLTVVRNLISNAIKFTPDEGQININSRFENDFIRISVIDNGMGISAENIDRLFTLDETFTTQGTNHESGTGLGLILCKDFIEKNGGEINVTSKPGVGSTFSFTLPVIMN